jgi:hypothetical protein
LTWLRQLLLVGGLAAVVSGIAGAFGNTMVVAVVAVVAALTGVLVVRSMQRARFLDTAIEALSPLLGARGPSREIFTATRWGGGWIGLPRRIRMRYSATVDDADPRFVDGILEQLHRRLGSEYRVARHLPRKTLLIVDLDGRVRVEDSAEVARAERVAKELLGASAKVKSTVDETGAVTAIDVHHDMGARLALSAYRQRIEKVLSSMLPGRWRSFWDLEKDEVRFEIRPELPSMILHEPGEPRPVLTHASYLMTKVAYCKDEDGNVILWQPSVSPHMLIIGGTGSGKTAAEHTLLTDLALSGWRVWVLDGKRIEFAGFKSWPNVELVASKVGDQVRLVHAAHDLMEERYSLIESGQARISDFEPLLLVIDEYTTFKKRVDRWYKETKGKGGPTQPPVFDLVADLARLARTAKIHMIVGVQRPDVEFLGGEMRDNFGARLSLGRLSPQGANMMWDSFITGVAIPRNKRGRGVTLNEESNPVEVQTFFTPNPATLTDHDAEDWARLDALRPERVAYSRKMIIEPSFGGVDDNEPPQYRDWARARITDYNPDIEQTVIVDGKAYDPDVAVALHLEAESEAAPEQDGDTGRFDGYDEADSSSVGDLAPGDLVIVDDSLDMWGVVELVEADLLEDGYLSVDYRDLETGEPSTASFPADDVVMTRRPSGAQ